MLQKATKKTQIILMQKLFNIYTCILNKKLGNKILCIYGNDGEQIIFSDRCFISNIFDNSRIFENIQMPTCTKHTWIDKRKHFMYLFGIISPNYTEKLLFRQDQWRNNWEQDQIMIVKNLENIKLQIWKLPSNVIYKKYSQYTFQK